MQHRTGWSVLSVALGAALVVASASSGVHAAPGPELESVRGGVPTRICTDTDRTCTEIYKKNNNCPTSFVCGTATCPTTDNCIKSGSSCNAITVTARYCWLSVNDNCPSGSSAGCGQIDQGTCAYTQTPSGNDCDDETPYFFCTPSSCTGTQAVLCQIDLCL